MLLALALGVSTVALALEPPGEMPNLQYSITADGHVAMSWDAVPGTTHYSVIRDSTDLLGNLNITFTDATTAFGNSYTYQVAAMGPMGYTHATILTIAIPHVPYPVANLTGQPDGDGRYSIAWDVSDTSGTAMPTQYLLEARFKNGAVVKSDTINSNGTMSETYQFLSMTGGEYEFRVTSKLGNVVSSHQALLTETLSLLPGTISPNVTLENGNVVLRWNEPLVNADKTSQYVIYRVLSTDPSGFTAPIGTTASNVREYAHPATALQTGAMYCYAVVGNGAQGYLNPNDVPSVDFTVPYTVYPSIGLQAEPILGGITLTWGYDSDGNGTVPNAAQIVCVPPNGTALPASLAETPDNEFILTGLEAGQLYTFHVTAAYYDGTQYHLSGETSTVTGVPSGAPTKPQNTTISVNSAGLLHIQWDAPDYGGGSAITRYSVYRNGANVANITSTSLVDQDPRVDLHTLGNRYEYVIIATNADGAASPSSDPAAYVVPASPRDATGITDPDSYSYFCALAANNENVATGSIQAGALPLALPNLVPGTEYTLTLVSRYIQGSSTTYGDRVVYPFTMPGSAFGGLAGVWQEDGALHLSWTAPAGVPVTLYEIYVNGGFRGNTTATTFSVGGLGVDFDYPIYILAQTAQGESLQSNTITAALEPQLSPLTGLAVDADDGELAVHWQVDTATGNLAPRQFAIACGGITVRTSNTLSYWRGLENGVEHTFQVWGVYENRNGTEITTPVATITGKPLGAPAYIQSLTVTPADGSLLLTWTAPPDGGSPITGYDIWLPGDSAPLASVGADVTRYTDATVQPNVLYAYSVVARSALGAREPRHYTSGMIAAAVPGAPAITATLAQTGGVDITWTAPNPGEAPIEGYHVYRDGQLVADLGPDVRTYFDPNGTSGSTYTVTAYSAAGEGAPSTPTRPTPPTDPDPEYDPTPLRTKTGQNEFGRAVTDHQNATIRGVQVFCNVRTGPGTQYAIAGEAYLGETIYLIEWQGEWCKVAYAGGTKLGWIHGRFISGSGY